MLAFPFVIKFSFGHFCTKNKRRSKEDEIVIMKDKHFSVFSLAL